MDGEQESDILHISFVDIISCQETCEKAAEVICHNLAYDAFH